MPQNLNNLDSPNNEFNNKVFKSQNNMIGSD